MNNPDFIAVGALAISGASLLVSIGSLGVAWWTAHNSLKIPSIEISLQEKRSRLKSVNDKIDLFEALANKFMHELETGSKDLREKFMEDFPTNDKDLSISIRDLAFYRSFTQEEKTVLYELSESIYDLRMSLNIEIFLPSMRGQFENVLTPDEARKKFWGAKYNFRRTFQI